MRIGLALPGLIVSAVVTMAPAPLPREIARVSPRIEEPIPLPRPRPRPERAVPDGLANLGVPTMGVGPEPQPPSPCYATLTSGLAVAASAPPIVQHNSCDALDVVRLSAVNIDRRQVTLSPAPLLRCPMATALATWMRNDVAPLVKSMGSTFKGFDNYDSFECRGRNRVAGAKTSEHGKANALDIRAVLLDDGRRLELTDPEVTREFRENMRASACAYFTTVLGPGSDGYHESHVHVDVAERRNGYRICQWNVRDASIPLPQPRPPEAPPREEL
jgi:hypothetical protein